MSCTYSWIRWQTGAWGGASSRSRQQGGVRSPRAGCFRSQNEAPSALPASRPPILPGAFASLAVVTAGLAACAVEAQLGAPRDAHGKDKWYRTSQLMLQDEITRVRFEGVSGPVAFDATGERSESSSVYLAFNAHTKNGMIAFPLLGSFNDGWQLDMTSSIFSDNSTTPPALGRGICPDGTVTTQARLPPHGMRLLTSFSAPTLIECVDRVCLWVRPGW